MNYAVIRKFLAWSVTASVLGWFATANAAEDSEPQVSVSLRGAVEQIVEQGEPWGVAVRLTSPPGSRRVYRLATATGTWTDALAVEIVPVAGTAPAARATPVGKPEAAVATLDANHMAGGLWRFSPESMQSVVPGDYLLRVQLRFDRGADGPGIAAAESIPLKVVPPAAAPPVRRLVNEARDRMLANRLEEAAREIDSVLRVRPRDPDLLMVRAQIAEQAGNPFAATMCFNAATFAPAGKATSGQPPAEELAMQARLAKARQRALTASTESPQWTWPPPEVAQAFAKEIVQAGMMPAPSIADRSAPATEARTLPAASAPAPVEATATSAATTVTVAVTEETISGVLVPAAELDEKKILADAAGQWASAARAGSQYSSPGYAAQQAVGAPDVPGPGDSTLAWCPARQGGGRDWLELTFTLPVRATEIRVRQSNLPGAIVGVEAIDTAGKSHRWWSGEDQHKPAASEIAWFAVRLPEKTAYAVARVKITLDLDARPGWKQLDAVQLVGTP